jgi:hypothetical protein
VLYLATLPQRLPAKIAFLCAGLAALGPLSWWWLTREAGGLLTSAPIGVADKTAATEEEVEIQRF